MTERRAPLTWDFEVFLVIESIDDPLPGKHRSRWPDERGFKEVERVRDTSLLQDLTSAFDGSERIQSIDAVCSVPAGERSHEELIHDSTLGDVEIGTDECISVQILL